ncbi:uncharacterized protein LOC117112538 [Anneissia japonica]|uniref:uncharacterized protein LOC117112538 n=1 Tax=Anneissia japonica TaxID=1529436 RepID=UPI001425554F|nr:uncharacterized protein LOC117112538 [Anneissia japonica]
MDITRGILDDITRPASSERYRPGSRISLTNASLRNTPTPLQSSLEILPPDNLEFQDEDLEVEEYHSSGEDENTSDGEWLHYHSIWNLQYHPNHGPCFPLLSTFVPHLIKEDLSIRAEGHGTDFFLVFR